MVVEKIPSLLNKSWLNKAKTVLNLKEDRLKMLTRDVSINLVVTVMQ